MLRILHNTNIDFISRWKQATIILALFLLPAVIWIALSGFGFGLEFTGGTMVRAQFRQAPELADVRSTVTAAIPGAEVQTFGSPSEIVVRAQDARHVEVQGQGAEAVATRIENALTQRFGQGSYTVVQREAIGPRVGGDLRRNALIAMLISFAVSLIYLAIRFEWRFGLAAVLATGHDILVTFAFIKLFNIEVSLTVIAGILTLLGYSMNDTIIIFDRVREDLRKSRKESLRDTLNRAINETLPRSILTHTTTFAAIMALLIFAGEVIRPFALVMAFGVVVATFSSIYVAGPLLLWIERKWPRNAMPVQGGAPQRMAARA